MEVQDRRKRRGNTNLAIHRREAVRTCLGALQVMRNISWMPRKELEMTALLTHLSGTCFKAGVTEKPLSGRGCPCFMITLALNIIKTNPFPCLHFLQAIPLEQYIKRGLDVFHQQDSVSISMFAGENTSPNNSSSFTYLRHSAILKGLEHTRYDGVSRWQAFIRRTASKFAYLELWETAKTWKPWRRKNFCLDLH